MAELVKEITMTNAFQEALQIEQDLLLGIDTDKVSPYIEDFICRQEPLVKVLRLICLQSASNRCPHRFPCLFLEYEEKFIATGKKLGQTPKPRNTQTPRTNRNT